MQSFKSLKGFRVLSTLGLSLLLGMGSAPSWAAENLQTPLLSLNQTLADNSTIQSEAKEEDNGFDETGVEPQNAEAESDDQATIARVSSAEFSEYYNDKLRELAQIESAIMALCQAKFGPPPTATAVLPPTQSTESFLSSAEPLATPVETVTIPSAPTSDILAKCYTSYSEVSRLKSQFESAWLQGNLPQAQQVYKQAKRTLLQQLLGAAPESSPLAARAIWLDRGSIVRSGSESGLRQLIQRVARSGFNLIFFETVNAGYPIYPSHILEQNPQVRGWDPLAVAVDEAHKNGIELHAWVWAFAVGNSRHNKLLGQSEDFVGPIISRPDMSGAALRNNSGSVYIPAQPERWLSPGKLEAREFLTKLYSEIVQNYSVDGLQLDYIRYPFQKGSFSMGYESMARFKEETGLNQTEEPTQVVAEDGTITEQAPEPKSFSPQVWAAWKAFQVSSFVRELSISLKKIKPSLTLSTAVFALPRSRRMLMIQQDWETWVRNGWIDVLVPMAYSKSPSGIVKLVDYTHDNSADRALVYPGVSLGRWRAPKLLSALDTFEEHGVMGTTMFAHAQLTDDRAQALGATAFSDTRQVYLPHRYPFKASLLEMKSLKTVLDAMVAKQNWLASGSEISGMQRSVTDIVAELEKADAGMPVTLSSRLRMQSRLASIESQLVTWKYASSGLVTTMQLKYLTPMLEHSARLVRFALSRTPQ